MNYQSEKIKEILKHKKSILITGVIFIVISLAFFGWAIIVNSRQMKEPIYLNDAITNNISEKGEYVNLKITEEPYAFAIKSDNEKEDRYYFLRDDNYFYIGYLNYKTYIKLNREDINSNPITIYGITANIPSEIKSLAIEVYNEALGEKTINNSNFEDYFGSIYIDVTKSPNDYTAQLMFGIIFGVIGLILTIVYVIYNKNNKKTMSKISNAEWNKINLELESPNVLYYKKAKLYLTENYLVDFTRGLNIIKFRDIIWIYPYELSQNGIVTQKSLIITTRDGKRHTMATLSPIAKKSKVQFEEIFNNIYNRNKDMLVGFTVDNNNEVKELIIK